MNKMLKYSLILLILVVGVSFIIAIDFDKDVIYLSKDFSGEGESWSIEITFDGSLEFMENDSHQLSSNSQMSKNVLIHYKGDNKDLTAITRVGVESNFFGMSTSSPDGLTPSNLNLKGGGTGAGLSTIKRIDSFEVTIYWEDDRYHEESFIVYAEE